MKPSTYITTLVNHGIIRIKTLQEAPRPHWDQRDLPLRSASTSETPFFDDLSAGSSTSRTPKYADYVNVGKPHAIVSPSHVHNIEDDLEQSDDSCFTPQRVQTTGDTPSAHSPKPGIVHPERHPSVAHTQPERHLISKPRDIPKGHHSFSLETSRNSSARNLEEQITKAFAAPKRLGLKTLITTVLKTWMGNKEYRVLYDTCKATLQGQVIWERVKGRKNLTVVIATNDGNVFGSYHSVAPHHANEWSGKEDAGHYVFSLQNAHNVPPTKFMPTKTNKYRFIVSTNDTYKWVVGVCYCYYIYNDDRCCVSSPSFGGAFLRGYIDTVGMGGAVFTNSIHPNTFSLKRMLILEW